jgi:hypothetical protein
MKILNIFLLLILITNFIYANNNRALIILNSNSYDEMQVIISDIEKQGCKIVHIYPPKILIGYIRNDITIKNISGVSGVYNDKINDSEVSSLDELSKLIINGWNNEVKHLSKAPAVSPENVTWKDCLIPPDIPQDIINSKRYSPSFFKTPPEPESWDTSGFMIGKVAIGIIFPESVGGNDPSTQDWADSEISNYTTTAQNKMNFWATSNPKAGLSFVYEIKSKVPITYEPNNYASDTISVETSGNAKWLPEVCKYLGYAGVNYFSELRQYCNDLRKKYNTNWAFVLFQVKTESNKGRSYAYLGGPFIMNYPFRTDATSHEAGHIFWALDEYSGSGASATDRSGYFGGENGNYDGPVSCIMKVGDGSSTICDYTKVHVGWRDSNSNSVEDLLEPVPEESGSLGGAGNYTGIAKAGAYSPRYNGTPTTIKKIVSVTYRVDNGDWNSASATDGSFNGGYETFTFYPTAETYASNHTLEIKVTDDMGYSFTKTLTTGELPILRGVNKAVCFPVPFNLRSSVNKMNILTGSVNTPFTVCVYNMSGEKIRELSQHGTEIDITSGTAYWDGKNSKGEEVASGIYFIYASSTGNKVAKGKIVVIKK